VRKDKKKQVRNTLWVWHWAFWSVLCWRKCFRLTL
jgi:hypothetical protein